jgi:HSP20 family protein
MDTVQPQPTTEALATLRATIDQALDETFTQPLEAVSEDGDPLTSTTLAHTDRSYLIKTGLPEVEPEQIEVVLHDDQVMIRAEITRTTQRSEAGAVSYDRVVERFYRSVGLPGASTSEGATAVLEDGVLLITIPKAPAAPPMQLVVARGKGSEKQEASAGAS